MYLHNSNRGISQEELRARVLNRPPTPYQGPTRNPDLSSFSLSRQRQHENNSNGQTPPDSQVGSLESRYNPLERQQFVLAVRVPSNDDLGNRVSSGSFLRDSRIDGVEYDGHGHGHGHHDNAHAPIMTPQKRRNEDGDGGLGRGVNIKQVRNEDNNGDGNGNGNGNERNMVVVVEEYEKQRKLGIIPPLFFPKSSRRQTQHKQQQSRPQGDPPAQRTRETKYPPQTPLPRQPPPPAPPPPQNKLNTTSTAFLQPENIFEGGVGGGWGGRGARQRGSAICNNSHSPPPALLAKASTTTLNHTKPAETAPSPPLSPSSTLLSIYASELFPKFTKPHSPPFQTKNARLPAPQPPPTMPDSKRVICNGIWSGTTDTNVEKWKLMNDRRLHSRSFLSEEIAENERCLEEMRWVGVGLMDEKQIERIGNWAGEAWVEIVKERDRIKAMHKTMAQKT